MFSKTRTNEFSLVVIHVEHYIDKRFLCRTIHRRMEQHLQNVAKRFLQCFSNKNEEQSFPSCHFYPLYLYFQQFKFVHQSLQISSVTSVPLLPPNFIRPKPFSHACLTQIVQLLQIQQHTPHPHPKRFMDELTYVFTSSSSNLSHQCLQTSSVTSIPLLPPNFIRPKPFSQACLTQIVQLLQIQRHPQMDL